MDVWGTDITGVTAHFTPTGAPAGTPDSGTQTLVPTTAADYLDGNFVSPADVQLPALGTYDVTLDVDRTDGSVDTLAHAGVFTYAARVDVGTLSADRTNVDYDHRTVTLSAPVSVTDPGTGQTLDPTGVQVTLGSIMSSGYSGTVTGTVGADGSLTATDRPNTQTTRYSVDTATGSTAAYPYHLLAADSAQVQVNLTQDPSRIRLTGSTNVDAPAGGSGTLHGVVEREVNGAWIASPGETLDVLSQTAGYTGTTVTTGADGTFAFTSSSGDTFAFENFTHNDPYLQAVYPGPTGTIHVPRPTSVSPFTVTEDEYGMATVTGTVQSGYDLRGSLVEIEFSYNNSTWYNAGSIKLGNQNGSNSFAAYGSYAANANGYWRARYEGSPDGLQSWSRSIKVFKTPTRVTGGLPNHTTVSKGQYLYFAGHVQQDTSKGWIPVRYSYVFLLYRPYGGKTWTAESRAETSSTGAYSLRAKANARGTWAVAWVTENGGQIDSHGPMTWVSVR